MRRNYLLCIPVFLFFTELVWSQSTFTFSGKPIYEINAKRNNVSLGIIRVELFPTIAPKHVINFDSLVSLKFFDTTAFHRVIPNFMIQGGDPNSRHGPTSTWGQGQPSQPKVPAEFSPYLSHLRGILSAARLANNINSATSQFFICVANYPSLDNNYSIYGKVVSGMAVADTIVSAPRNTSNNMPLTKIEMFVTRVGSNDTIPSTPVLTAPPTGTIGLDTMQVVHLKWTGSKDVLLYYVEVATDVDFFNVVRTGTVTTPQFNVGGIAGTTTYYWRVRSNNGGNYSDTSEVWNFTSEGDYTSLREVEKKKSVTVFPNPGSGLFTFASLKEGSTIKIYDISGRTVKTVIASEENLKLDLRPCSQGLYFYSVTVNKIITQQGKLIIRQ